MKKIFVTGAAGYVGSHLLNALEAEHSEVLALIHNKKPEGTFKNVTYIEGDIRDHKTYEKALKGVDLAVHAAALIGNDNKELNYAIHTKGAEELVTAMKKHNVKQCIYVSSISAGLPRRSFYADSKLKAERILLLSGIPTTVLRYNLIIGKRSPQLEKIAGFALKLPVVPVVGSGKKKIQPIDVDTVVNVIIQAVHDETTRQRTYTISGRDAVTFNEFLDIVTEATLHKKKMKVHLPIFVCNILATLLQLALKNPPLARGQLILLNQDTISSLEDLQKTFHIRPESLKEIIERSFV